MKFTMAVSKTVATPFGHAIRFEAGVPTHVPKECWRTVQEHGAVPEDQETVNAVPAAKPESPDDPLVRAAKINEVFTTMVERNKREDFTGSGMPRVEVISQLAGFDVDAKERDTMWGEFVQNGGTSK